MIEPLIIIFMIWYLYERREGGRLDPLRVVRKAANAQFEATEKAIEWQRLNFNG